MKFNLKVILLGGLVFYVAQFILSMITGPLIHEGALAEIYNTTAAFWRPELNQDPPDMAALMPRWFATGLLGSFVMAGIYDNLRSALNGSAVVKGVKYGVILFLINLCISAGWSGVFNLPEIVWVWWNLEALFVFAIAGSALGFCTAKLSTD